MKAVVTNRFGAAEVLDQAELLTLTPGSGPGPVRIKVLATTNYRLDRYIRKGGANPDIGLHPVLGIDAATRE